MKTEGKYIKKLILKYVSTKSILGILTRAVVLTLQ